MLNYKDTSSYTGETSFAQQYQTHRQNLSWCAGFYDGDGCSTISKQQLPGRKHPTYRLRLHLVQNCHATLHHFQSVLNEPCCFVQVARRIEHNKQLYALVYDGRHALAVLGKLEPYLIRKHIEAQAAIQFWFAARMGTYSGPKGFPPEVWEVREYWYRKLQRLK